MKNICIVTSHPFWSEPLGCGSLMRSRYELLSQISATLRVIFITRSEEQCPLPNSGTLKVDRDFTEMHVEILRNFVEREKISVCYFSYAIFDELAARLPCKTVVEVHDVLHLRQESFAQFGYEAPVKIDRATEIESLRRFDAVLCINLDESRYLAECGVPGVSYLPPVMPFSPVSGPVSGMSAGLIGSQAVPNVDGLEQAIGSMRQPPHLVIAGGLSNDPRLTTHDNAGIERLGVLPDVRRFYERINVALSPIRFGGGLKIKVFEALANGKPVIATSHSVEGFPEGIRNIVSVEDDFTRWNVDLLQKTSAISLSDIRSYYTENFSMEKSRQLLLSIVQLAASFDPLSSDRKREGGIGPVADAGMTIAKGHFHQVVAAVLSVAEYVETGWPTFTGQEKVSKELYEFWRYIHLVRIPVLKARYCGPLHP